METVSNKRNQYGVKDSSDCYRTFNGEHYICWCIVGSIPDDRIAAYKAAGAKVRRIKAEIYIRATDKTICQKVDHEAR